KKWEKLEKEVLTDSVQLRHIIGKYLVEKTRKRFYKQDWVARRVPNIAGIVFDLDQSTFVKPSRFRARPTLVDTGQLRDSYRYDVRGTTSVGVYSTTDYSNIHQEGGTVEIPISHRVKKNLRDKSA